MKKYLFFLLVAVSAGSSYAQTKKTVSKPKPPVAPTTIALKTLNDSASYAMGLSLANFYKGQGVATINTDLIARGVKDIMEGKKPAMDDNTGNNVLNNFITIANQSKHKSNIEAGEEFLKQNKTKQGVWTSATGLQYEIITQGDGERPTRKDQVKVNYKGTLLDGTEFDNSYKRGQPATFGVTQVIAGWTEGLQFMNAGSKFRFYIPYQLAYGVNGTPTIPGGSMLIFEVELLEVIKGAK